VLRKHVSVVEDDSKDSELFRRIIDLRVGEGLLFAPSAVVSRNTILEEHYPTGEDDGFEDDRKEGIEKLGSRFLKAKIRRRLTADVSALVLFLVYDLTIETGWEVDCVCLNLRILFCLEFLVEFLG